MKMAENGYDEIRQNQAGFVAILLHPRKCAIYYHRRAPIIPYIKLYMADDGSYLSMCQTIKMPI